MSTSKHIDRICLGVLAVSLVLTLFFMNGATQWVQAVSRMQVTYEDRLFDTSKVHQIDIVSDDWDDFIETCEKEEYTPVDVTIDGETYKNAGIRAKGNTSLSTVSSMGSDRYSFKIEFDHYNDTENYYGLDKLVLNNLIQDNTMMKDYLTYRMMNQFGVAAPLCSYVYITVNGEDWGLYLAVEGMEEGFLRRNYGSDYGNLYKPDDFKFGGSGKKDNAKDNGRYPEDFAPPSMPGKRPPENAGGEKPGERPPENADGEKFGEGGFGGMGSEATKLQYIDENPDSYEAIFSSAKTDITPADRSRLIKSLKALSTGEGIEEAVDVEQVLRYFVVHNFVVNGDSYTGSMIHNYYLYEDNGRLSMLPWDYNLAFGTFQDSEASDAVNDPIDAPLSSGEGERPMLDWIFDQEGYTALYHQYFREFLETVDFTALIEETAELIAPYVEKDPGKFCTFEEFETGVETLRAFCLLRAESVRGQLDGTISSKSAKQDVDNPDRVDASAVRLSDMGSMERGGGPVPRKNK